MCLKKAFLRPYNSVQPLHFLAKDRVERYHIACDGGPEVYLRLKNKAFKKLGEMVKNSISAADTLLDIKDDIQGRINILVSMVGLLKGGWIFHFKFHPIIKKKRDAIDLLNIDISYLTMNGSLKYIKRNKELFLFPDHLLSYFQLGSFQPNIPGTARFSSEQLNFSEREETLKSDTIFSDSVFFMNQFPPGRVYY